MEVLLNVFQDQLKHQDIVNCVLLAQLIVE